MNETYEVTIDDEPTEIQIAAANRTHLGPVELIPPAAGRSLAMRCFDGVVLAMAILLPIVWLWDTRLSITLGVLVGSLMATVYGKLVWRILEVMGPPDYPHVLAIVQAPEKIYCPQCGEHRTQKYCPTCGINLAKEYRQLVRRLAVYATEETHQQRMSLEKSLYEHLNRLAAEQKKQIEAKLSALERMYVMEMTRHQRAIQNLRQQLAQDPPKLEQPAVNSEAA